VTFGKAAYARGVLRAMTGEKVAASMLGAAGSLVRGASGALNNVWQKSMAHNGTVMGTIGVPLGLAGAYALGKHAIGQTRAAYHGFQPEVQAYTRQSPY
jgi:hypothetical protein